MPQVLQHRRGPTSELNLEVGTIGEFWMDESKNTIVVMDGTTVGGHPLAKEIDIPVNVSDLVNDAGYITAAAVFSGSYNDLSNVPTAFTPAAHNQAWSTITGRPTTLAGYGITDASPLFNQSLNTTNQVTFSAVTTPIISNTAGVNIRAVNNVAIITDDGGSDTQWIFATNGSLTFPDGTAQSTAYTGASPFDQDLNTTDSAEFTGITTGTIGITSSGSIDMNDRDITRLGVLSGDTVNVTTVVGYISIASLKTIAASSSTYADFQAAIAAL